MNEKNNNDSSYASSILVSGVTYMHADSLNNSNSFYRVIDNDMFLTKPLNISWNPQEDITTFELALCMPLLLRITSIYPVLENEINMSEPFMRHFKVINPNNK